MRDTTSTFDEGLIHRVRCEFLEMPGLRLTRRQAHRRVGLDTYLRLGEGAVRRPTVGLGDTA